MSSLQILADLPSVNFISLHISALLGQPVQKTVSLSLSTVNTHLKVNRQVHTLFIFSLFVYLRMSKLYCNGHPKYHVV